MDTKQLRQKILDLAIHGKLVPQDPNDEPASVLLERIRAEKERLIKEGKIKKSRKTAKTSDTPHYEQVPFEVPEGWAWTTVSEITNYGECSNTSVNDIEDNDWVLELEDIEKDSGRILFHRTKLERDIKGVRHPFYKGTILYSKLRTYLNKVLVAEADGFCTTEIIPFRVYGGICPDYICHVLRSEYFLEYTKMCGYGVKMPRLSTSDAQKGLIPLPPVREQIRIVNSITKWFETVDSLESSKDILEGAIIQAKAKILDLAIHGKLVPQDPSDEPAIDLLRRINPKFTPCDNAHYTQLPFEIPDSWTWVKHNDVLEISGGSQPAKSYFKPVPEDGYIRLYQIRDYGETPIPVYIPVEYATKQTEKGDILLARYGGSLGKVFIAEKGAYNVAMAKIIFKYEGLIDKQFAYYYYLSDLYQGRLKEISRTAQAGFNSGDFAEMLLPIPPLKEQKRIVQQIAKAFAQLDNINKSLAIG